MLQQYVCNPYEVSTRNDQIGEKKPNANAVADDMHLPILVADDNCICYLLVRCAAKKKVLKGLVKGEAIHFLRSNSSQDNYQRTISTFRHHLLCRGYPKILLTHSSL